MEIRGFRDTSGIGAIIGAIIFMVLGFLIARVIGSIIAVLFGISCGDWIEEIIIRKREHSKLYPDNTLNNFSNS